MNKGSASALGWGVVLLPLCIYGLKNKKGWIYWLVVIFLIAPIGGVIGFALGKEDKEVKAFILQESAIEACRKRKCKDKGGFYLNGRCEGEPKLGANGNIEGWNYHELDC